MVRILCFFFLHFFLQHGKKRALMTFRGLEAVSLSCGQGKSRINIKCAVCSIRPSFLVHWISIGSLSWNSNCSVKLRIKSKTKWKQKEKTRRAKKNREKRIYEGNKWRADHYKLFIIRLICDKSGYSFLQGNKYARKNDHRSIRMRVSHFRTFYFVLLIFNCIALNFVRIVIWNNKF